MFVGNGVFRAYKGPSRFWDHTCEVTLLKEEPESMKNLRARRIVAHESRPKSQQTACSYCRIRFRS